MKNTDMVNHPQHYTHGEIECIDAMERIFTTQIVIWHCAVTSFKYIWRYQNKSNPRQDIEKAIWYLTKAFNMSYEIASLGNDDFIVVLNDEDTCTPYLKSAYDPTAEMYIAMALNTFYERSNNFYSYNSDFNEYCYIFKTIISYLNNALALMSDA